MFHYLFTNDLRISNLQSFLVEAAKCFRDNKVPSAAEDKNANNNMNTLGYYFNLTADSNCTKECCNGNVRKVVLNFIKKFQFPNPRTSASLKDCVDDGIQLAPMRIILQILYIMHMICPEQAYLSKKEIADYVFFNEKVAKNKTPDIPSLVNEIIAHRDPDAEDTIPDDDVLEKNGCYWKQCKRQVREMVKVLCWSGCVVEDENGNIRIQHDDLSRDNEADLFEIITYSEFWNPDPNKNAEGNKESYQEYMDIKILDNKEQESENMESRLVYITGIKKGMLRNRIIFGAPGTGKSFMLNKERKELLDADNETDYERVTFHPDYSYANFVGTYKPVMVSNKKKSVDKDTDCIISILNDPEKTAQEKYDVLLDKVALTRLPILLGIYLGEESLSIIPNKKDGSVGDKPNFDAALHIGIDLRKQVDIINNDKENTDIGYAYVPGPFMRVYVNALKSARSANPKPYLLLIEEINRANVAAVFGDVFQLLDRDENEVSEYPIQASEDIKKYLAKELGGNPEDYNKIKIPDNMFIWATMNSADQGVFPMDTAFKRRWDFTYIGIDKNDEEIRGKYVVVGSKNKQKIEWNELRKSINEFLAEEKINEDKQLGPYFISRKITVPVGEDIDAAEFAKAFKNKVLMYLFDDAAKQKRLKLFEGMSKGQNRYSEVCKAFDEQGIGIFNAIIQGRMKNTEELKVNEHEIDGNGMPIKETE